jgi:hypothetical protein
MNKRILAGAVVMAASVILAVSGIALADKDKDGYSLFKRTPVIPVVNSKLYTTECGACHFAYQPGWLPAHSWQNIMASLDQHFGENAELDRETRDMISHYLVAEAADNKLNRMSSMIMRSISTGETPFRISTLPYMLRKHHEIPERFFKGNTKVGSRASCAACHTQAKAGFFDEDGVTIPGYGRWED